MPFYLIFSVRRLPEQEHLEVGSYLEPVTEDFFTDVDAHIRLMKERLSFYTDHNDYKKFKWACIYKVPEKLRKVNEDAYTPRVVSLGPYHRGKPHLEAMEPYKWRCLDRYLTRSSVNLDMVAELAISEYQRNARRNYQDSFDDISVQDFSQMIMLDCIFIIELILENVQEVSPEDGQPNAKIFDDPWIRHDILHDMMLLENQVPLEILADLCSKCFDANTSTDTVHALLGTYFTNVGIMDRPESTELALPVHLVDFLGKSYRPTIEGKVFSRKGRLALTRSATELHEAGVKFEREKTEGNCLLDIYFTTKGVLKIPQLKVNKETETLFRNLIAFEQCRRDEIQYITSYVILMDSLINTPKDVKLLVRCGVIENLLEDNELVSNLFNNLPKETVIDNKDFYFANVCEDLNNYSKDYWHQWKAAWLKSKQILRRDYLSNTWTTISVVAASILLVLTVIQTVCSILQL
ncbi:hypothetical protein LguiA_033131 [Lonicera macranthoides]